MRAQLAVVVSLHSTAPIYSPPETSSSVPATTKAQDTERWSSFKETASQKVAKNSHADDIVQAFTENGTPVKAIDTKTDRYSISLMPSPEKFFFFF